MAAKFIILSLLVASVYGSGGYSSFSYGVSDPNTGDVKDQHEKRVGSSVVGKYSLLESDGTKRIVEYEANDQTGFNAIVRKEPASVAPLGPHPPLPVPVTAPNGPLPHGAPIPVAPTVAPVTHPTPIAPAGPLPHPGPLTHPAPLTHAGPLAHSAVLPHPNHLPHPDALVGALAHPGALANPLALAHRAALAHPVALAHRGALTHPAAFAHASALAHPSALDHPGIAPHPGALKTLVHSGPLAFPGATHLSHPGFAGLKHNLDSPQGVPAVSHFSQSVVHEDPRSFIGPYAGGYNGPYGGYVPYGRHGDFVRQLAQGLNAPLGHGLAHDFVGHHGLTGSHGLAGPLGIAHSYNSQTRGEAYPHGYAGYGAGGYGAGLRASIAAGLAW